MNRPNWACTPADEVHVVVPEDKRNAALELTRWVFSCLPEMQNRFSCPKSLLLSKVRNAASDEAGSHLLEWLLMGAVVPEPDRLPTWEARCRLGALALECRRTPSATIGIQPRRRQTVVLV